MSLCVVEVFGSLFQNVCLQSSRSLFVSGLIILLDFVQAIVEVRMHMDHKYVVDGRHCVQTAVKIIKSALFPGKSIRRRYDRTVKRSRSKAYRFPWYLRILTPSPRTSLKPRLECNDLPK